MPPQYVSVSAQTASVSTLDTWYEHLMCESCVQVDVTVRRQPSFATQYAIRQHHNKLL